MVEDMRDEDVVHGGLQLDTQREGNIHEPVCPDDVVAVNRDAGSIETTLLFRKPALGREPEQAVSEELEA